MFSLLLLKSGEPLVAYYTGKWIRGGLNGKMPGPSSHNQSLLVSKTRLVSGTVFNWDGSVPEKFLFLVDHSFKAKLKPKRNT